MEVFILFPAMPMPMTRRPATRLLVLALALAAAPAFAQKSRTFSETVFFGDSLTDGGFFRPLLPASAQAVTGQFTTNPGLVWSQYLADYYGTNGNTAWLATGAAPRADAGSNYAVGGARVGVDATGALGYTPSLTSQVNEYLRRTGGRANPNALYTVWGGANDLFAITAGAPAQATLGSAVAAQVGLVGRLAGAGAQYILVPTIPDLGVTPSFRAQGAAAAAQGTALAKSYNDALFGTLAAQNLRVIPLDTFNLLREIAANPAVYGLRNVTGTACQPQITAQSLTCNPGSYVSPDAATTYAFADGVHPSTAAQKITADYATATIEAPRQIALLPRSAAMSGRARADMVAELISTPVDDAGRRVWGDLRYDSQRFRRGMAGDGFDGGGPALTLGFDQGMGSWRFGGYATFGQQRVDFGLRRGDFRQREAGVGGVARWQSGGAWLGAQLAYTHLEFDVNREVPLGVAVRAHQGTAKGRNLIGALATGWTFSGDRLSHGPVLRITAQDIRIDGYGESDPQLATALSFPEQKQDVVIASAGWEAKLKIRDNLVPFVRATFDREYGDEPSQAFARMTTVPSSLPYAVPAPQFDRSYGTLSYGVRSSLWGMDLLTGSQLTVGQAGGNHASTYVTVSKRF